MLPPGLSSATPALLVNRRPGQDKRTYRAGQTMPTLFRFLAVIGLIVAVVYGAMLALALLVEPTPREMSVRIPAERLER